MRGVLLALVFLSLASIPSYAEFSIVTDVNDIDFGLMAPSETRGDIPPQGVTIRCITDQGRPWTIRTRLQTPLTNINNPASRIENDNFWWYGSETTGAGQLVTSEQSFLSESLVYTSSGAEGANGIDVKMKFKLTVPPDAQSGKYSTVIVLTMTE